MRTYLRVLLISVPILVLAIALPLPAQSGAPVSARPVSLPSGSTPPGTLPPGSVPPSLLPYTSPYTYYLPYIAKTKTLTIYKVTTSQGTSLENVGYTVAGRKTVIRAFVSVADGTSVSGVSAILWVMSGTTPVGSYNSNTITAPSGGDSDMSRTLNFDVDPGLVQSGYSYYIEVSPNGRYPQSGTVSFNALYARPLQVMIIPINYLPFGAPTSTWPLPDYSNYLEWMPQKVFPIPSVSYSIHSGVQYIPPSTAYDLTTESGWSTLLTQISTIHSIEDPGGNYVYYGIVNIYDAYTDHCAGCYTGLGWIGNHIVLPTAVGWSGWPNGNNMASGTMTHEMGHNFGREHVLCAGNEAYPDPYYPYPGGFIGVWGMDTDTHTLYNPATVADYMSYCPTLWTSDYTYAGIKSFRDAGTYIPVRAAGAPADALFVSGTISPAEVVTFRPTLKATATTSNQGEGTHVLDILDQGGAALASYTFTPARIGDSNGESGFGFFVPSLDGAAGLRVRKDGKVLGEKQVAGAPAVANFRSVAPSARRETGGTVLRWSPVTHPTEPVTYSVRISRDGGATWQVLALDLANPQLTVPTGVDLSNTQVEIQASDGIHVVTQTITLGQVP